MPYFDDLTLHSVSMNQRFKTAYDQRWPGIYSLQFLFEGTMVYGRDHEFSVTLTAPAIYWIDDSHRYQLRAGDGRDLRHYVIFSGPRGKRLIHEGFDLLNPEGWVDVVHPDVVLHVFKVLHRSMEDASAHQAEAVLLLEQLLANLLRMHRENLAGRPHYKAIEAAARHIRIAPLTLHDFRRMAGEAHLSYSHFRRLFREYMGRSPHDYQLHCRMQWAARELQDETVQVKQVALDAGYEDPGQFSRTFRTQIGLSPLHYRESLRL